MEVEGTRESRGEGRDGKKGMGRREWEEGMKGRREEMEGRREGRGTQ